MKPLPSRLESFWIGAVAGAVIALAFVPTPAKSEVPSFHETERHPAMRNDR